MKENKWARIRLDGLRKRDRERSKGERVCRKRAGTKEEVEGKRMTEGERKTASGWREREREGGREGDGITWREVLSQESL